MNEEISCTSKASSRKFCVLISDKAITVTETRRQKSSLARGKPILWFLRIHNQNYRPIGGVRHIFNVRLYTGSLWLFVLFLKRQYWYVCKVLEQADRQHADDSFRLFYGSLWTVVIRPHIYFTDCFFFRGSLFSKLRKLRPLNLPLNST